jgi:hypothetical protein
VKLLEAPPQIRHTFVMTNTKWKKGKNLSFPVRDGFGNDINFRLECQLDKGNKRFVLRWQDPTDLNPQTRKKKSKTKSFRDYEKAYQFVKEFEFREDLRNDKAKSRVTFLNEKQLRDAEVAFSIIPNNLSLKQLAENYLADLPTKEASINEVFNEWIKEANRANKRSSTITSRKDRTREFRSVYGAKKAHQITYKDVESVVFKKLKNGKEPKAQTIKNRWSGIRALMNRAIDKGYVRKDGNPCEQRNGFSELPSPSPSKTFLSIKETRALIKHATEYKEGVMLAYFSLACFSGLRPHEIHGGAFRSPKDCDPLTWNDIDLDSESPEIFVSDEQAKTSVARWAPLGNHNLNLRLLLLHTKASGKDLVTVKNFKENWRAVVKLSKLSFNAGAADSSRRSFATYLYNKDRSIADRELSRIMGNSPYVLNKHYKTMVKAGEGSKYFKIGPNGKMLTKKEINDLKIRETKIKVSKIGIQNHIESLPAGMVKYHDPATGEVFESKGRDLDDESEP